MSQAIAIGGFVSEFAGDFPQLDLPPDINAAELEEGGKPFFVTLPIIPEIGAVSGNGLLYDDDLALAIEFQINSKRPGANFGHLAREQRATAFPHPKAFWVAARRVGETLWAKAYVPAGDAREHLRNLMKLGGRIGTSIFGNGDFEEVKKGVRRLNNFVLETIDFAPPERSALGYGAPVMVTSEMAGIEGENNMSEQELRGVKVPPNKGWKAPFAPVAELRGVRVPPQKGWMVQEPAVGPETTVEEMTAIREALGVPEGVSVAEMVGALREQVLELTQAAIISRVAEMVTQGVRLENARGIITKMIYATEPQTVEEAEEAYSAVMEMQEVKDILALSARASMGPAAIVSGKVQQPGRIKLDDSPEARRAAIDRMGINI